MLLTPAAKAASSKIQIRRLGMTRAAATGDVELEVKDVQ